MKDIYCLNNISIVVDNNVLVDLYELECLSLMFEVFDQVIIPQIIYDEELSVKIKEEIKSYKFVKGHIETELGLETYSEMVSNKIFRRLSKQDRFAIAIAKENFYYCNSNDKPVRNACETLGVKYTGVLGVLGRAYFKKHITKEMLENYLDLLISSKTSCFIDKETVENFKKDILKKRERKYEKCL